MLPVMGEQEATLYQVIAADGEARTAREDMALSDDQLHELLRWMVFARRLDEEAVRMHADGELSVYPPFSGQEAAQVGSAYALEPDDFVFPSFREMAAAMVRGIDPATYLQYHRGARHGGPWDPIAARFAPVCVPLATQIPHAVGYAMGMKLDSRPVATIAYFGDGATSEGDFHEACNWAAVFKAPVVLFCQNNGWAISIPFHEQAAAPIVARAAGYGIPGVRVDGNDVLAVWQVTKEATERARWGKGPTLIEAVTFRMGPHLTNDDPGRYRNAEEVERWRALDPIDRFRTWMGSQGLLDEPALGALEEEADAFALRARAETGAMPPPTLDELFEMTFEFTPHELLRQQARATGTVEEEPDEPDDEPPPKGNVFL
jgi:pyruvate dehydrogenase E1 component alpha subunit